MFFLYFSQSCSNNSKDFEHSLGKSDFQYRANDDGEPSNSAGMPLYGQLQSFDVTNTLVVVVRYFGGTKLGVGGLIQAYKTGAQMALEASKIVKRTIDENFILKFESRYIKVFRNGLKDVRILAESLKSIRSFRAVRRLIIAFFSKKS